MNWQPLGAFERTLDESVSRELEERIDRDFPDLFLLDDPIGDRTLSPQELLAELGQFESSLALGVIWIEEPAELDSPLVADWVARALRSHITPAGMDLDSTTLEPGVPFIMVDVAFGLDGARDTELLLGIAQGPAGEGADGYLLIPGHAAFHPWNGRIDYLAAVTGGMPSKR